MYSRAQDRDILSTWLDSLDISKVFDLNVFCLIERFCFVARRLFPNVLVLNHRPVDDFGIPLAIQIINLQSNNLAKPCVLGCLEENFFPYLYSVTCGHLIFHGNDLKHNFFVWEKGYRNLHALPAFQQDGYLHTSGRGEIVSTTSKSLIVCGGWDEFQSANPTNQVFWFSMLSVLHVVCLQVVAFSFESNNWQSLSPMVTKRDNFASVVLDGNRLSHHTHVMALGGVNNCEEIGVVEMYSLESDSWSSMKAMPTAKCIFGGTVYKNVVVAGPTSSGSDVTFFDFQKQDWARLPDLPPVEPEDYIADMVRVTCVSNVFCGAPKRRFFKYHLVIVSLPYIHWLDDQTNEWHCVNVPVDVDDVDEYEINSFLFNF